MVASAIVAVRVMVPPEADQPEGRLVMVYPFGTLPISDEMSYETSVLAEKTTCSDVAASVGTALRLFH